ncbi:hypothetical protein VUR80DRAFT_9720 [Thermomyces stellatus]
MLRRGQMGLLGQVLGLGSARSRMVQYPGGDWAIGGFCPISDPHVPEDGDSRTAGEVPCLRAESSGAPEASTREKLKAFEEYRAQLCFVADNPVVWICRQLRVTWQSRRVPGRSSANQLPWTPRHSSLHCHPLRQRQRESPPKKWPSLGSRVYPKIPPRSTYPKDALPRFT